MSTQRGLNTNSTVPVQVEGLSRGVTAIAAGAFWSHAIKDGAVWHWGQDVGDFSGPGDYFSSSVPVLLPELRSGVTDIAAGYRHHLAIKDGNVWAWGQSFYGAYGIPGFNNIIPHKVLDLEADFIDVAAGNDASYALSADGSLWVWGRNDSGQLGLGYVPVTPIDIFNGEPTPKQVLPPPGYRFTSIASGVLAFHAMATISPIPEPSTTALLPLAALGLARFRRP